MKPFRNTRNGYLSLTTLGFYIQNLDTMRFEINKFDVSVINEAL